MTEILEHAKRVAVVGGGITGLAAAHRLHELEPSWEIALFESADRLGGVMQTEHCDGFCIERGPDSMITQMPWGLDLCRRIGFSDELIGTNSVHRKTYVVRDGRLLQLPEGLAVMAPSRFWPVVTTPILSIPGKLRLGWEYFVRSQTGAEDTSLAEFARRRVGREAFERLVQPLASGIYMGDPERLSVRAAFPRFVEMETKHGSLIRGTRISKQQQPPNGDSGPRYSLFVAPRQGMSSLIDAIAARIPQETVRLNHRIEEINRLPHGWALSSQGPEGEPKTEHFDAVVVATNASAASRLFSGVSNDLSTELREIEHSGCVVVVLAYDRSQIAHALDGFGFVVPHVENRQVLACTFSSVKYDHRAPKDNVLLRVFLGGTCRPEAMDMSDESLLRTVSSELEPLLGITGQPKLMRISRWPSVMPQYNVGHLDRVERIETAAEQLPRLALAGNAYRGVGIPHCIHSGEQAAEKLSQELNGVSLSKSVST